MSNIYAGTGLGKGQNGIVEPIKASLKFDKSGIGHDIAKEFTNNWWDLAYKKAANNFEVEEDHCSSEVKIKAKKKQKSEKKKKTKTILYGSFQKGATLNNGQLIESAQTGCDHEADEKDEVVFKRLTDEELFEACGGVTAPK